VALTGWLIVAGLYALAILRLTRTDSSWLVVIAISVSPWLYFLAWIVAAASAAARRWVLAATAGVLVVASLVWLVPQWYPFARAAAPTPGAVPLRLFDANVQFSNPDMAPIAAEILADHPDLITLEEISHSNLASLSATGVLARYRWHYVVPVGGAGFGVWSDVVMTGAETWYAGPHPEVRAWLRPIGTPPADDDRVVAHGAVGDRVGPPLPTATVARRRGLQRHLGHVRVPGHPRRRAEGCCRRGGQRMGDDLVAPGEGRPAARTDRPCALLIGAHRHRLPHRRRPGQRPPSGDGPTGADTVVSARVGATGPARGSITC